MSARKVKGTARGHRNIAGGFVQRSFMSDLIAKAGLPAVRHYLYLGYRNQEVAGMAGFDDSPTFLISGEKKASDSFHIQSFNIGMHQMEVPPPVFQSSSTQNKVSNIEVNYADVIFIVSLASIKHLFHFAASNTSNFISNFGSYFFDFLIILWFPVESVFSCVSISVDVMGFELAVPARISDHEMGQACKENWGVVVIDWSADGLNLWHQPLERLSSYSASKSPS